MTELFGTALSNANARELPRLGKKRKVLASWRLSLALLLLSFVPVIYAKKCGGTAYEWWRDDIKSGNRAFLVEPEGRGGAVLCLSKGFGSSTELLDPVIRSIMHTANFDQQSKMPCSVLGGYISPNVDINIPNGTTASTARRRLLTGEEDICAASRPDLNTCKYPMQDELGQWSWGGIAYQLSQVNGNCTTPDEEKDGAVCHENARNELQHDWKHSPVYGGDEISCDEVDGKNTRYSSGVMFSQAPLPYDMKYRIYMFSSETERLAALDDTRNTGLKYAKKMKGENGCDVEIVYEFFPKPGGGISVSLSQVMGCTIPEDENKEECKRKSRAIADSTSAYISNDVVVVQVKQSTLRESQYLPVRPNCDKGTNSTTIKMSTQFICAATGERINITSVKMSQAGSPDNQLFDAGGKRVVEISRDQSNPTTFQFDPANPSDCWYKNSCGGWSFGPGFSFEMDAASAPESCGSFYWDPLILSVAGDGMAASVKASSGANESPTALQGFSVLLTITALNFLL